VQKIKLLNPLIQLRLEDSLMCFLMVGPDGDVHGNLDWWPEDFCQGHFERIRTHLDEEAAVPRTVFFYRGSDRWM
jgi:hypothetical protein